jgi:hypothetical protein
MQTFDGCRSLKPVYSALCTPLPHLPFIFQRTRRVSAAHNPQYAQLNGNASAKIQRRRDLGKGSPSTWPSPCRIHAVKQEETESTERGIAGF